MGERTEECGVGHCGSLEKSLGRHHRVPLVACQRVPGAAAVVIMRASSLEAL
ncbi:hypothetical protein ppKF707_0603 [Metapseudomonas furukawaii]|uniref:Uncharacterized protein n=1 Tax=Metapseudomonas furukawaii TaxID=1149133 RepID=A0AAD1BZT7_METFU|nr:hypothetical protein ppKF707_0603 [Pseudomonas furukawaii]BAU73029.1 hypothetical protein KF707C_13410 [Pseudomonas furukawaii]